MLQDELTREQVIHHNKLIMQRKDQWQLRSTVLQGSLNLLDEEVCVAWLITLLSDR